MKVPYVNLSEQYIPIKDEILKEVEKVIISGQFILSETVTVFERKFAELCNTKYAVGVANGTDALILSMKVLGIGNGDEVITVPNSFIATTSSIVLAGAKPVFVDVRNDMNIDPNKIERAITKKTKAIIPVHLTGRPADMKQILEIAHKYSLYVIEDAAQAVRAEYLPSGISKRNNSIPQGKWQRVGSFGTFGCFSFHPLKNLSACGDGGIIISNDKNLYETLIKARNHGLKNRVECEFWSYNSRLDSLQAAILNVKLNYLEKWINRRREIASIYQEKLKSVVNVPIDKPFEKAVYHTFIIQTEKRDEMKKYLAKRGIDTKVHYPIPIHLQKAAKSLGYKKGDFPITEKQSQNILSLPIYPELKNQEVLHICGNILNFMKVV